MLLICNVCHPERPAKFTYGHDDGYLHLAKWYPGGMGEEGAPYYRNDNGKNMGDEFLEFLDKHKHGELPSKYYLKGAGQENPVRIEYEIEGLPKLPIQKK